LWPFVFNLDFLNTGLGLFYSQLGELFAVTLSVFLARRFLDRRSFSSLGLKIDRLAVKDLLVGFGIPFLMIASVYLIELSLGWLSFESYAWQHDNVPVVASQIFIYLLAFILVGWNEELLSRGYHLQNLASGLNLSWAVVISSALFGFLHIGNPNAIWTSVVGILFAGVFLAFGYLRTRQLWLPIGLHIGWNFFEGVVFGFPVSGTKTYSLLNIIVNGPSSWTGGPFGPEGGLVLIPGLLLGFALVQVYSRKRSGMGINGTVPADTKESM
jgi:membrane protease YdiL (CAAX protease family)